MQGVRFLDVIVRERKPQFYLDRTQRYWQAWVSKEDMNFFGLPEEVVDLYKRSLLIIRTQVDNRGGIVAGNDSDFSEVAHGFETYSYVWPRDGAYVANALDKAGYGNLSERFYEFCNDVIHTEQLGRLHQIPHNVLSYMLHKYTPDRFVASNWMPLVDKDGNQHLPIQEDETALIPYCIWRHWLKFRRIESINPWYRTLVIQTGKFMAGYRDTLTRLPAPSFDLWEEGRAIYSFTTSTVWAGLHASANFAEMFGDLADAERFRIAANQIKEACETYLYDENEGRFLKSISVQRDGSLKPDYNVDASLYGLWYFGMFEPSDARIERTMDAIVDRLLSRAARRCTTAAEELCTTGTMRKD